MVALGQGEDGEAFGDRRLELIGEPGCRLAVGCHQLAQLGLGGLAVAGIPDAAQLLADGLAGGEVVLIEIKRAGHRTHEPHVWYAPRCGRQSAVLTTSPINRK